MADNLTKTGGSSKQHYSIEAPGVLRSNANYNVSVNLFEAIESSEVKISLKSDSFYVNQTVKVKPMSTELLSFEIPDIKIDEVYYLQAESLKGININEKIELRCEEGKPLVYIQCDKAAYKRNDKVDYRVIFLEPIFLKPANPTQLLKVVIKHMETMDIVFINCDVQLKHGIHTAQWQIPEMAAHGVYTIKVFLGNSVIKTKDFEVINYKPPKFVIKLNTAKEVFYAQKKLFVVVDANYNDGHPVKGSCKIEMESVGGYFSGVYIEKFIPIVGRTQETIVDIVDDLRIDHTFLDLDYHFTTASIMVKVTVVDEKTNAGETITEMITIKRDETVGKDNENGVVNAESETRPISETTDPIKITIVQQDIRVDETLNFTVQFSKPTKYCAYFVTARGNILKSEVIPVADYNVPITCSLESTFQFVPRAFILAYYIYEDVLYFDEVGFNFSKTFHNKLKLIVPKCLEPGSLVPIEIQASPNSKIALMAVDELSVVPETKNNIMANKIFSDLHFIRSKTPKLNGMGKYPGIISGLVTLTNARINDFEFAVKSDDHLFMFDKEHITFDYDHCVDVDRYKNDVIRTMREQNQVFGNWFFMEKETDNNGNLKFEIKLPEKTTTWLLTAFTISPDEGFVITEEPIKIVATANNAAEPITELPKVHSKITEFVVDHYDDDISKTTLIVAPSANTVPLEISLSITENLFGPTIAKLSDHAGIMYCTGHLHMTTVIPNINVLEYLDHLNQLDSEFAMSIKNRFPEAIERELCERHEREGSFSWFASDAHGSSHVTSLVLQAFQRVSKYVEVAPVIIKRGLAYLASTQKENGEFAAEEKPYEYPFQAGIGVGLTSMVLLTFLQNEEVKHKYKTLIDKAFAYIVNHIEDIVCVYDLALAFYALQLARHDYAKTLKERLLKIAKRDNIKNYIWWPYSLISQTETDSKPPISELEVTSYVLLALLETESIVTILPIIKWMLPTGDFANETMDRAIALDAILKAATKCDAALALMNITYTAFNPEGNYDGKILLTPENSSHILTYVLPLKTEKIELSTQDKGSFFGKLTYRYKEL